MTATTMAESTPVVPSVASKASPLEYVRSLDADQKHAVFMELLREAVELNGENGLLPIEDVNGDSYGYFVPPKAARALFERAIPNLTDEERERSRRAIANLDRTFDMDEFLNSCQVADAKPS